MEATLNAANYLNEPKAADERLATGERMRRAEQDRRIEGTVEREQPRLRRFIRRRVGNSGEADDILQEVFYELVEAYRLMKPIEEVTAWLFQVARNRVRDLAKKKRPIAFTDMVRMDGDDEHAANFDDLLPSADAGPEAAYARGVLLEELEDAIDELPAEQREAFVGHELEGRSFKEMAAENGTTVNAMILRKHYAVEHLRKRLAAIREEFGR